MSCIWILKFGKRVLNWRRLQAVLTFGCLSAACANPTVNLSWLPESDPGVAGYRVHYGGSSGIYTNILDAQTNLSISIPGLTPAVQYFFAVAAYNTAGIEGPLSGEVAIVVPTTSFVQPLAPRVSIVSPASATPGTQIQLYGTNLSGATSVEFGGTPAVFVATSDNLLIVTVPSGAKPGLLTVLGPNGASVVQFNVLPLVPPGNDNFANAQPLSGPTAMTFGSTTAATKEPNEPNHAGNAGGSSIWYRWTAPADGAWTLDVSGSTFETLLAVYSGNTLAGLSIVASNKTDTGYATSLTFNATHGVVYNIAVDGVNGASGQVALQLTPSSSAVTILSSTFDSTEGFVTGTGMAAQNGWICNASNACGIANNVMAALGQVAYIGYASGALASNPVLLYHPLNYVVDTNGHPIIQFSVQAELKNLLSLYRDAFGWAVRNSAGHQLFSIIFDNSVQTINYQLDNGAGPASTGITYGYSTVYTITVTMDFSRNLWSATLNGSPLLTGQPMTTTGAALTLGDIDATANFVDQLTPGLDAMAFDNFIVTALPSSAPRIWSASGNQSVTSGSTVSLGVTATGAGPLAYQWFYNGTIIPIATGPTLVLRNATPSESGNYSVTVLNGNGSVSAQSTVTITSPPARATLSHPVNWAGQEIVNLAVALGNDYRLQASTNLSDWTTLSAFHAYGTNVTGCDPDSAHFRYRFYRVVSP